MSVALLMNALVYASMLVLMAQAHTLTYLTSDSFNLTVGPLAAIGAYMGYTVAWLLKAQVYLSLPAAFAVCGLAGLLCCVLVAEPLLRRYRGPVLVTLALMATGIILTTAVQCYAYLLMTRRGFVDYISLPEYDFHVGWVPGVFIVSTAITVASVLLHEHLLNGTLLGASLRAVAEDADLAMAQGINPNRVRRLAWALAGGLAGLAGAYGSIWFIWPQAMGTTLTTGVLAACLLGGVRSIRGAALGGLIMGVLEIVLVVWSKDVFGVWMGEYRLIVPIAVLALTMYLKPRGLLATNE
ncbi:hypothetical protein A3K81_02680 [Candidatus Bathyarchaeota archaeon RBG_13_60_20]|nr:MAG: hypothetical protein A3K81_02680 [Candidatus Bathyarchaeota archaeon RBG_13_60_20]